MSLRRRPNVLKVASRDDAEAGDEVTEAGEKTNSKPNDKIRSVKGTDRIFSPSIVNDGGVHDQDRKEPRTYNATNKQTVAMAESKTDKKADNKADKQADNKTDKQANNKADKQADNKADKQADNKADKQADNKADKQADNKADKQADNKADKQADNKADKQADNKADKQADNKADKQADNKVDKVVDNRTDKEGDLIEQGSTSNVLGGESEDDRGGVVDGGAGRTRVRITADNYEEVLQRLSKEEDQCMEDKRRKIDETIDFFAGVRCDAGRKRVVMIHEFNISHNKVFSHSKFYFRTSQKPSGPWTPQSLRRRRRGGRQGEQLWPFCTPSKTPGPRQFDFSASPFFSGGLELRTFW